MSEETIDAGDIVGFSTMDMVETNDYYLFVHLKGEIIPKKMVFKSEEDRTHATLRLKYISKGENQN